MSLAERRTLDEDGVTFASHLDGSRHRLTPERAVEIQDLLDATLTMVLDECTSWPIEPAAAAASRERSMRWADRSKAAFRARSGYGLFGNVQGSVFPDLRARSAEALVGIGFDGYAIGGLAVGEGRALMLETVRVTAPALPAERPRYLMGVGKPADLIGAVARGIDLFDCVLPTRSGRTAQAWTADGPLNLRNQRHADDPGPLEPGCTCPTCQGHSRGYLHHLIKANEILGAMLLTWHNLHHYQALMATMREAIEEGRLTDLAARTATTEATEEPPEDTAAAGA
jgi:queuine tRNA-ribosyltransferase